MSLNSSIAAFDLFTQGYMIASIALVLILFVDHLVCSFLDCVSDNFTSSRNNQQDFYTEVKKLLNPQTPSDSDFSTLSLEELFHCADQILVD